MSLPLKRCDNCHGMHERVMQISAPMTPALTLCRECIVIVIPPKYQPDALSHFDKSWADA